MMNKKIVNNFPSISHSTIERNFNGKIVLSALLSIIRYCLSSMEFDYQPSTRMHYNMEIDEKQTN